MTGPRNSELVEQALAAAPPDVELVVIVDEGHRANLRWAQSGLTTNGLTRSSSLTVIAVVRGADGVRSSTLTRSGVSASDVDELVSMAAAQARAATPNTAEAGVPLAGAGRDELFDESSPGIEADVIEPLVEPLARALSDARSNAATWSGYAEAVLDSTWLGSSAGSRRVHHQRSARLEATSRSVRADGQVVSSWAGAAADTFTTMSVPSLARSLDEGRRWSQQDVDVEPGRHTVILTAAAVADLMIPALWAASARDAVEGRSAYGTGATGARIGERLMGPGVDIVSDPFDASIAARPFVVEHTSGPTSSVLDNGAPLERTEWITDGVLRHLIGPRAFRQRLDAARPVIDSIRIKAPGAGTLDDLIARTDNALLITCLWYIRDVDPQTMLLTGLTRDGVFQVRDGRVVGAAPNFRFNVSPLDLMSNLVDGTDAARVLPREWGDYVHRAVAPALRVERFNLSTRSDAR